MSDFLLGYCVGATVVWISMVVAWIIAAIILSLRS